MGVGAWASAAVTVLVPACRLPAVGRGLILLSDVCFGPFGFVVGAREGCAGVRLEGPKWGTAAVPRDTWGAFFPDGFGGSQAPQGGGGRGPSGCLRGPVLETDSVYFYLYVWFGCAAKEGGRSLPGSKMGRGAPGSRETVRAEKGDAWLRVWGCSGIHQDRCLPACLLVGCGRGGSGRGRGVGALGGRCRCLRLFAACLPSVWCGFFNLSLALV